MVNKSSVLHKFIGVLQYTSDSPSIPYFPKQLK
jgi:hypothetical protein